MFSNSQKADVETSMSTCSKLTLLFDTGVFPLLMYDVLSLMLVLLGLHPLFYTLAKLRLEVSPIFYSTVCGTPFAIRCISCQAFLVMAGVLWFSAFCPCSIGENKETDSPEASEVNKD
jgi:hypothetical protein